MGGPSRGAVRAARVLSLLAAVIAAGALAASPAWAQQPVPAGPSVLDGPGPDIQKPSGLALSIARDGSGGLVYLKSVAGVPHVFAAALVGGSFQPPVQLDAGLPGSSSQPVMAAGNGGLLLTAFVNGGELYVVNRQSQLVSFGAPLGLAAGAINPAVGITNFGKAYLAFAVPDSGGYDVRAAYYYAGRWAIEGPPLNATAGDDAGTGGGRPALAAAGDGVAIVVWGEGGHIYSRRVWKTSPSAVFEQADAPPGGCSENSANEPVVGTGGDSSFAPVAFHETAICGGRQQSRVLMNRLHGSVYDGIVAPDGLAGATADGADDPQVTMTEYGQGWITSQRIDSRDVVAGALFNNGLLGTVNRVNGVANAAPPHPVPATAGLYSTLIAWQQEPGSAGGAEIRVRYAPDGATLGPEDVISGPTQGPTDAANGLTAAGDVGGDAAVAWLQGPPGAMELVTEQMYQPPGAFPALKALQYARSAQPVLAWRPPREPWGPMSYVVSLDGSQVAQTHSTSTRIPGPITDGPHTWQVTGSNPAGQQTQARPGTLFVDTVPPHGAIRSEAVGSRLAAYVTYSDPPPAGEPRSDASGVSKLSIRWGDGTTAVVRLGSHRASHRYRRPGRYRILLLLTDKAGNVKRVVRVVKVLEAGAVATPVNPSTGRSRKSPNNKKKGT